MTKINAEIDLLKIDKSKIVEKTYKDKSGKEVTQKIYKFDVVPLKEATFVTEGDTWIMKKTHFLAESQTKEERAAKASSNFIGSGFQFEEKGGQKAETLDDFNDPLEGVPF